MPPLGEFDALFFFKKKKETRESTPPPIAGVKNWKKKTTEHYKADSRTPQKLFVYCSIAIIVQRWFMELKMALL